MEQRTSGTAEGDSSGADGSSGSGGSEFPLSFLGRMMRRSVFRDLMVHMMGFGSTVGALFPLFAWVMLDHPAALSVRFFAICIAVGMGVGLVYCVLLQLVVSREVRRIAVQMDATVRALSASDWTDEKPPSIGLVTLESADDLGRVASGFNAVSRAVQRRLELEWARQDALRRLGNDVNLDAFSEQLLRVLEETAGAVASVLYVEQQGRLCLQRVRGFDAGDQLQERISERSGLAWRAVEEREICVADGGWRMTTPYGVLRPEQQTAVPLIADGQVVGVVVLAGVPADSRDRRLLAAIAQHAGPVLQNVLLHRRLEQLAALDDLTQLWNRRFGIRRLREEFARSQRYGTPMALIMVDVDHFKLVNDNYGHDVGDVVLKMIANTLARRTRQGELACRYGGEEFLVVLNSAGTDDACVMAERLRAALETARVRVDGHELQVTASMGVVSWPAVAASKAEDMVKLADEAMYAAKAAGRNRVMVASPAGPQRFVSSDLDAE